ncbi:MAG: hypothetical protein K9G58_10940 [Bacteroidales bacterium]|nr:hypothetical protein [Bacteroidales bacterium]MCF8387395.1 hypothetical protein [Bacteroidales bacterium]MCF8398679.1 hypothetical protein [Bacteroidales bacterium]
MKSTTFLLLIPFFILSCTSEPDSKKEIFGPYLGQEQPGEQAKLFAPGIVSNGMNNRDMAITPDGNEIYFCSSVGNHTYMSILMVKNIDGKWSDPEVVSFAQNPTYTYLEPCLSSDGNRMYFASNQPMSDTAQTRNANIWYTDRNDDGWDSPKPLNTSINTAEGEFFPSVTNNGYLYFTRDEAATGLSFIYRARQTAQGFSDPVMLPGEVNNGVSRYNAFASPNDDFLIVPMYGREDSYGGTDYYIVYHHPDDSWSDPVNLGPEINSSNSREWSPYISPDGKYLFFMSARIPEKFKGKLTYPELHQLHNSPQNGNSDIYWISSSVIDMMR